MAVQAAGSQEIVLLKNPTHRSDLDCYSIVLKSVFFFQSAHVLFIHSVNFPFEWSVYKELTVPAEIF